MNILPKGRTENITEQDLGDELMIYDFAADRALNLNETAKLVFRSCDGRTSFGELNDKYHFTDELIFLTLEKLQNENLLEGEIKTPFAGLSRREVIKKVGLGTMVALPVISGLVAPTAARAASGLGQPAGRVTSTTTTAPYPQCSNTTQSGRNAVCAGINGTNCPSGSAANSDGICNDNYTANGQTGYSYECYCV